MAIKTMADVKVDGSNSEYDIDLGKLCGSPVARVEGYVSRELGCEAFKLTRIVLADGRSFFCEGSHDFPYLTGLSDEQQLSALYVEANGEDE